MYKVLIADDESIIRTGINNILRKDNSLIIVAMAEDGQTALKKAYETKPDILIVDINMPFMNGLSFVENIQQSLENPQIIIVTGHDDFEYAQRAIHLKVIEYLLKPINEDKLKQAVNKAKNNLKQLNTGNIYIDWAKQQLIKNKKSMISQFINLWLNGELSNSEIEQNISFLNISLNQEFYLILIKTTEYTANENLSNIAMFKLLEDLSASDVYISEIKKGLFAIISNNNYSKKDIENIKQLAKQNLNIQVDIYTQTINKASFVEDYCKLMEELAQSQKKSQIIVEACEYIEQNFADFDLSLSNIANALHISSGYLSRLFHSEMNIKFFDYIQKTRIRHAIEYLRDPNNKIYEIAEKTGYTSQHYFSNAFKKVLGISPSDYRKELQQ